MATYPFHVEVLLKTDKLVQAEVREAYSKIARTPELDPPFPTGRDLALNLGYPPCVLDSLPSNALEAFCGVSNVSLFAEINPQDIVLDLGCGAGLDTLIAARRAAKVIGIDFSLAMLERAQRSVQEANLSNQVTLLHCSAQGLPLLESSVDKVIVNGIFNLNPHRQNLFNELARVVRPGGAVFAAEIILKEPLPYEVLKEPTNWYS